MDDLTSTSNVHHRDNGSPSDSAAEQRWLGYLEIVVSTRLPNGRTVDLTGPEAIQPWPYTGIVHVLSAWDPYGVAQDDEVNRAAHAQLADALAQAGLSFDVTKGSMPDSTGADEGFVVRGVDRAAALEFGRMFGQEAIFEIDADEIRMIHCTSGREDRVPRIQP